MRTSAISITAVVKDSLGGMAREQFREQGCNETVWVHGASGVGYTPHHLVGEVIFL